MGILQGPWCSQTILHQRCALCSPLCSPWCISLCPYWVLYYISRPSAYRRIYAVYIPCAVMSIDACICEKRVGGPKQLDYEPTPRIVYTYICVCESQITKEGYLSKYANRTFLKIFQSMKIYT